MANLSCFAPHVQRYVEEVLKQGKIGICSGTISVVSPSSGCSSFGKKVFCDRFKLIIPYGGHTVTWDVLFHASHPEFPPDFIFPDCAFRPQLEDLESLCTWKPNDSTCLLKVIQELIAVFRKQEVEHLEQYSRLQFEYSSLVQQTGFTDDDVEVYMTHKSRGGPVSFLIRVPVDFSKIPPVLTQDNPGEDSAVLLVTFQTPEGSRITPQLFLSPRVEHSLGGSQALRIPSFPSGGCLMDYVPSIRQLLVNKVDQIVQGFEKRKEYIASFLSHFGRCVIEYDAESLSKMTLLFEWNDFYFLLHITIPLYFPQDKPSFTFQSVYHATLGRPYSVTCSDYPYSPRWSAQEMSERAKLFFLEYIAVFQRSSIKNKG